MYTWRHRRGSTPSATRPSPVSAGRSALTKVSCADRITISMSRLERTDPLLVRRRRGVVEVGMVCGGVHCACQTTSEIARSELPIVIT